MTCNQKSALTTVATAAQTVVANGYVNFTSNNLLTGIAIAHTAGSNSVRLLRGLYLVTLNADISPAAAGDIGLQLVRDGVAVAVSGAEATVTGAVGDTYNVGFATLIRVLPSCCVIDNNATLQVQATAAGTVDNVSLSVVKLA